MECNLCSGLHLGESICFDSFLIITGVGDDGLFRPTSILGGGSLSCPRLVVLRGVLLSLDESVAAVVEKEEVFYVLESAEEDD